MALNKGDIVFVFFDDTPTIYKLGIFTNYLEPFIRYKYDAEVYVIDDKEQNCYFRSNEIIFVCNASQPIAKLFITDVVVC